MQTGDFRIYQLLILIWLTSIFYFAMASFAGINKRIIESIMQSLKNSDSRSRRTWNFLGGRSSIGIRIAAYLFMLIAVFLIIIIIDQVKLMYESNIEIALNLIAGSFIAHLIVIMFMLVRRILYKKGRLEIKRLIPAAIFAHEIKTVFFMVGIFISLLLHVCLLGKYVSMY